MRKARVAVRRGLCAALLGVAIMVLVGSICWKLTGPKWSDDGNCPVIGEYHFHTGLPEMFIDPFNSAAEIWNEQGAEGVQLDQSLSYSSTPYNYEDGYHTIDCLW